MKLQPLERLLMLLALVAIPGIFRAQLLLFSEPLEQLGEVLLAVAPLWSARGVRVGDLLVLDQTRWKRSLLGPLHDEVLPGVPQVQGLVAIRGDLGAVVGRAVLLHLQQRPSWHDRPRSEHDLAQLAVHLLAQLPPCDLLGDRNEHREPAELPHVGLPMVDDRPAELRRARRRHVRAGLVAQVRVVGAPTLLGRQEEGLGLRDFQEHQDII
mmetsp:Transcript_38427/g.108991  ORF Transcript_38427/g.108991 Transcript_38427/m.108991 type:complete len:211 (-) Transcript_38427:2208-2840(-)